MRFALGLPNLLNRVFLKLWLGIPFAKTVSLVASVHEWSSEFERISSRMRRGTLLDVVLPSDAALLRRVALPQNVRKSKIADIVRLEVARATPMPIEQLRYAWRSNGADASVEIAIVRSSEVELVRRMTKEIGCRLARLRVGGADGSEIGVLQDDLPQIYRAARGKGTLNTILLIGLVVVGLWPAWDELRIAQARTQALAAQVEQRTSGALELRVALDRSERQQEIQRGLAAAFLDQPRLSDALRALTIHLPDTVWLSEIGFREGAVLLGGVTSGSAADLVLSLAREGQFSSAQLVGPVSFDPAAQAERFEIVVGLSQ